MNHTKTHAFMQRALLQARRAAALGEVPVGAVVVETATGEVLAEAHNLTETRKDVSAHAELLALRSACAKWGEKYLPDCTLFVTLEPCAMCAQALAWAHIGHIYFGAYDPKSGACDHGAQVFQHSHHKPNIVGGILEQKCQDILTHFFNNLRQKTGEKS